MEIGTIQSVDIDGQMREAFLDYAMSVIVARALPDARDGLKPVHRRILFAMSELGMRSNTPYKKSARIVGEVLGKYHPHGDMSVYDAMARMVQDFSMRYPLIDGQGNFGSVDGDPPAAMRYTEARLGTMAEELLSDIDKNTVDFTDNFDGSLKEPLVLPARLPNLLLNGSVGIAVGMATNIPPHNLRELCNAINYLIDHYDQMDEVSVDDLMAFLPGPDFPTGGIIVGAETIKQMYSTGRGRLIVRGQAHAEEAKNGRFNIIITEIPYQINKTTLIERIADLAREGRLDSISDLRDESDRTGMSIVLELKRGAQAKKVLNQLYKYTPLQTTFGAHILALVDNEPRLLSLKRALQYYIEHRQQVITRRAQFELDKARARAHILDGLLIALANLDAVIQTIRQSPDVETARDRLMANFKLTEIQAQAILDMQLRRLAALERQKIEDEYKALVERIAFLEDLLASPHKILEMVKTDLNEIADKHGDDRRTKIAHDGKEGFSEEDLVADEHVLINITQKGYIKRVAAKNFRTQMRGGRGVTGQNLKGEDEILMVIPARTLQTLLFFTNKGKVYSEKVYQLPDAQRTDRGISIQNVLALGPDEAITAAVPVPEFSAGAFCTMATANGKVKRVSLAEFASVRPSGLIAIGLEPGDELGWVRLTSGKDDIILVTANGQALRFNEASIRPMGRPASGMNGIHLTNRDQVASMEVIKPGAELLVVTEWGYGKRTPLADYPIKGRATNGVLTIDQKNLDKVGRIATARVVEENDEVTLISASGLIIRMKVKDISQTGRATRGVRVMDLTSGDTVVSVARISEADLIQVGEEEISEIK
ncbi:MAG TPA: DNA gyrase subunit A [Bellilinea sp.]|nr:DNA gyrase subunit A [Bellilinea sp.]